MYVVIINKGKENDGLRRLRSPTHSLNIHAMQTQVAGPKPPFEKLITALIPFPLVILNFKLYFPKSNFTWFFLA